MARVSAWLALIAAIYLVFDRLAFYERLDGVPRIGESSELIAIFAIILLIFSATNIFRRKKPGLKLLATGWGAYLSLMIINLELTFKANSILQNQGLTLRGASDFFYLVPTHEMRLVFFAFGLIGLLICFIAVRRKS